MNNVQNVYFCHCIVGLTLKWILMMMIRMQSSMMAILVGITSIIISIYYSYPPIHDMPCHMSHNHHLWYNCHHRHFSHWNFINFIVISVYLACLSADICFNAQFNLKKRNRHSNMCNGSKTCIICSGNNTMNTDMLTKSWSGLT